ncbi:hypothetical protein BG006_011387 [Podila minutissima]|uniref:F-box domain-containing protein n=1 Tax=Podila minutissima TaxID=64525 RepID=A0A9P5SBZ9_9FUNG|nr:hypothetical protein BG006_011387 [Podila minutissima]
MADHTSPMNMPEILLYVAAFLAQQDLVTCTSVSRQWYQAFTPCLWKKFQVSDDTLLRPTPDILCKHAPQIRNLTLRTITDLDPFLERLTNLQTLIIIGGNQFAKPESWLQLTALVQRNPRIEWIALGMNREIGPPASFLRAIPASCPNLRRYESSLCLYEDPDQIDALLGIFSRAKEVWTRYESFAVSPVVRTYHFPNLVELALKDPRGLSTSRQVDIICMCPNLQLLKWAVGRDTPIPVQEFCERVPQACPKLKHFHMDGSATLPRESVGYVLDALKDLESLMLFGCAIGESLFRSMTRHFLSLTSLDVMDSFQTKSSMAQRILENCPNLTHVSLALLCMQDVVNGRPWQATRLQHLQVDLVSLEGACRMAAGGNKDSRMIPLQQMRVFEQLSKLPDLRHLAIGHLKTIRRPSLEFRVEHGLTLLKSLTRLTHLSLEGTVQDMTEEDADWLGQNLRNLDTVEGRLCSTVAVHEALRRRLLKEYRVEVLERDYEMEELSIPSGRSGQDPSLEELYGGKDEEEEYSDDDYEYVMEEQIEYEQATEPGVLGYQNEYEYAVQEGEDSQEFQQSGEHQEFYPHPEPEIIEDSAARQS